MARTVSIPIRGIIGTSREVNLRTTIERFACRDKDVEGFLKNKAIDFDVRHKSRTYLVIDDEEINKAEPVVYGYFTLVLKTLGLGDSLSKSTVKRIDGFSRDVRASEAVLIGQLGKNMEHQRDIDGQAILDFAIDKVYEVHELAGGRIVYLECNEIPKVVDFYVRNDFVPLQRSGDYLQMIRYL
jgi:hypothetical protein